MSRKNIIVQKARYPLGISLAFMMAIAGLSLHEGVMLKRVLSLKLLGTFLA